MFSFEVKQFFFDRPAVMRAVAAAQKRNLSRLGAFVWRRMKSSIRKRRRVSEPGEPPTSRMGYLRNFIFFAWDPPIEGVVIGPARLNRGGEAPGVLEHGGAVRTRKKFIRSPRHPRGLWVWTNQERTARVAARPYAGPALHKEAAAHPELWLDSVRAGV